MSYTFNYSYNLSKLTAIIIGFTTSGEPTAPTNIIIPKNIISGSNTYNVVAIDDNSFYKNNLITGISFDPNNNCINIGSDVFASCSNLKTLDLTNINSNVTIGYGAFTQCECLTNIISSLNNPSIYVDKVSGYLYIVKKVIFRILYLYIFFLIFFYLFL